MAKVDIPGAKRAGLPVDLDRLTAEGDDWLSPEERYALKTHGVCAQTQPHVFMIRTRTSGGIVSADMARGLARIADDHGKGWIHLTTRQQLQFHHVRARDVATVLAEIGAVGLSTRSTCGHTLRGVMSCPDSGVGLDEPFDCYPDARAVSDSILARTPALNAQLPSRFNICFGGCPACRDHAKTNEAGFVSTVRDGALGYELWLGGSLGKSAPTLAFKAADFVARNDVLAAANALLDVYITYGNFDQPNKARMKFLVRDLGRQRFLELFRAAYAEARERAWPEPTPVSAPEGSAVAGILAHAPEGGWGSGVRPQRTPGLALVTVNVPLGDIDSDDLRLLADLSDEVADGNLCLTRNQNVMFRHVPVSAVPTVRRRLADVGLGLEGADQSLDVRVCTGGPVCTLAITPSQAVGARLLNSPALVRNSGLRVHVSGCPNACAQHQAADLGFSGGKVTINGRAMLGYQVWLGGDLRGGTLAQVVGRITEADVLAITEAIVGLWEALRVQGETLSDSVNRIGLQALQAQIDAVFKGRWAPGPEPADPGLPRLPQLLNLARSLPLAVAS
ncbi:MAG: nitrite/sulfite reductase [Actinomycetota bacterium]|nr:nitrite/sulfite reductase [Actinomycetota bacterium]